MRIGVYDPYLDDLGGGEKYMMTLATCLAKFHSVSLFWDNKKDIDAFTQRFGVSLDKVTLERNIFAPNVSAWERLKATKKFDVIIVLSDGSIPLTLSKKLLLHVQQPLSTTESTTLKKKLKLAKVTKVFYNSEFTRDRNKSLFPGVKTAVLYPPVSFIIKSEQRENIILHVGRFRVIDSEGSDYKKQEMMITTFEKMIDKGLKGWKLVIAAGVRDADRESFANLEKSAKGYPIIFMINKTSDELATMYHKAKIYWHASGFGEDLVHHPEFAEHFGISTVEAMGAGTVPVVINAGGQKEIIQDGIDGFLWDTEDEFIAKTNRLIKDPVLWQSVSEQAKKRAKDFSVDKFCHDVNELIKS
jgi:glycosyltransferase involved in cell wall biosynthesis